MIFSKYQKSQEFDKKSMSLMESDILIYHDISKYHDNLKISERVSNMSRNLKSLIRRVCL